MENTRTKNELILEKLFEEHKRPLRKDAFVSLNDLRDNGWEGIFPSMMFQKYNRYWIHMDKMTSTYKIVKVEDWMLSKSEQQVSGTAPLPIDVNSKPTFSLKDMYKQQIIDQYNGTKS